MNREYVLLYMISVLIAAFSQVLLKISANNTYSKKFYFLLNPLVMTAYGLFFLSLILTTLALREIPYKMAGVMESCSYLFILGLSVILLHEKPTVRCLWGNIIIILGILVFNG